MNLLSKSVWIFFFVLLLLIVAAAFPSPFVIMLTALTVGGLIIWQAVLILKDDTPHEGKFPYQ